ncbi:hypothetical protein JHK85_012047 [Glycine max]|nr:hypothetical protein JHK85_012047 [Glycine max]
MIYQYLRVVEGIMEIVLCSLKTWSNTTRHGQPLRSSETEPYHSLQTLLRSPKCRAQFSLSLPKPHKRCVSVSTSKLNVILTSSSFPCQPCSLASFSSSSLSFKLAPSHSHPFLHARAASVPESSAGEFSDGNTLEPGALFGLWIIFNIYNKQVLKVYHFPLTVSTLQFAVGTLFVAFMWGLNFYKRPKVSGAQIPTVWVVSSLVPIVGGVALASATEASFNW